MSGWFKLFRAKLAQPQHLLRNRETLKKRREKQFSLMNNPNIVVDEGVLDLKVRDLVGKKNLAYAFGRQAIKYSRLNALADVNFEAAINRPDTIPFSVKDHLRVKGMIQTCGLSDNVKPGEYTCEVARMLEENGMTPYVHSNIPQGLWGLESTNFVFGECRNPYNEAFTSGGSSGGECVLVKTKSSAFGLGSDSAGSLRIPASFSGVYSFKPTGSRRFSRVGRIALSGDEIQVVKEIDACMGFVTKCVDDLQFLLSMTMGKCQTDWAVQGRWNHSRYENALKKKFRVGFMTSTNEITTAPAIVNCIYEATDKLRKAGHEIVEFKFDDLPNLKNNLMKFNSGVYVTINRRLNGEKSVPNNEEYIELARQGPKAMAYKERCETIPQKRKIYHDLPTITLAEYLKTIRENEYLKVRFRQAWQASKIDFLISPTLPFTALLHGSSKYLINLLTFCCFQNLLEMPAGVVPVRLVRPEETVYNDNSFYGKEAKLSIERSAGLPVGIQLTAKSYHDEDLLAAMAILEGLIQKIPDPPT